MNVVKNEKVKLSTSEKFHNLYIFLPEGHGSVAGKWPFGWRMQYLSNITTLVKHETSNAGVMCRVQTIAAGRQFPSYSFIVIFKTGCSVRINQDETQ